MDTVTIILLIFTSFASYTDFKYNKIPNMLNVVVLMVLVFLSIFNPSMIFANLLGAIVLFGFFLPLYLFKVIGGGDLKMLLVIGFAVGIDLVVSVTLLSIFFAGLFSLLLTLVNSQYKIVFSNIKLFLYSLFLPYLKIKAPHPMQCLRVPIALPIGISAIICQTGLWRF